MYVYICILYMYIYIYIYIHVIIYSFYFTFILPFNLILYNTCIDASYTSLNNIWCCVWWTCTRSSDHSRRRPSSIRWPIPKPGKSPSPRTGAWILCRKVARFPAWFPFFWGEFLHGFPIIWKFLQLSEFVGGAFYLDIASKTCYL